MSEEPQFSKKNMSRRDFLKIGAVATAGAVAGAKVYSDNQVFFDKAGRSVLEGKILQDVGEVIDSQFAKKEKLLLGEDVPYNSEWLEGFFESEYFFGIEGQERGRIAFLEITDKANVAITTSINGDLSFSVDNDGREFMLLPAPQHTENNKYLMHTTFNKDGESFSASEEVSESYGGVIIQNGLIRVGYPGDFENGNLFPPYETFDKAEPNSARVDYFFVLDSKTLEQDLVALERGLSGKNMRNAQEFANAIVTFYSSDGTFKTFAMSSFRDFNLQNGEFEPRLIDDFTIPQMASLAKNFADNNLEDIDRFMIAFPDPGPNQNMVNSTPSTIEEIRKEGMEAFLTRDVPEDTLQTNNLYRTFGGNASSSSVIRPLKAVKPAYLVVSR